MLTSRSVRCSAARPAVRVARPSVRTSAMTRSSAVSRRAAYSTGASPRGPVTSAELKEGYEVVDAQAIAQGIYSQTLVPTPQWDKILGLAEQLPADLKGKYTSLINDIKNSRGDDAEIDNAFKNGTPLPEDFPMSEELNAFIGKFSEEELHEAYENALFGYDAANPNPKFLAIGAEVSEALEEHENGEAPEEFEEILADEKNDEDGGAWAQAFAESLSAADGLDEHVILSTFQTAEAVSQHAYASELFENPALIEGEKIAAREAYWENKQDGAGTPYVDQAFTDSEVAFLVHIAKSSSDFDTAANVFRKNLKSHAPSALINDQFLEFAFNRDKLDEVFKGVDEIKAAGLAVSVEAYSTAIRAAASKGDVAKATGYLNEAKAAGYKATTRMYAALVFANGKAKQLEKARAVLKDMEADGVAPDGLVYHALILAEFKNGKADAWERIKKEMAEKNVTPHPLSNVFLETEQLEVSVPKINKKVRTPAQRKAKKSTTNANILAPADAAKLMDVIEEKAFQRKQGLFVAQAGNFYTPLAPVFNTVGGATTQRVHVNRLILSAHRFPHHHRLTPIAKLLIEGYFLEGTKQAPKAKKGQKIIKNTPKGFAEFDVDGLETAVKNLTEKFNKAGHAGDAITKIPDLLQTLADGRTLLSNPALKAEAIKTLEEGASSDPSNAASYKTIIEWAKKHDGAAPKKLNKAAFSALFDGVVKAGLNTKSEPIETNHNASAAGADLYTHLLKRVAQTDKNKAAFYAHALDGWFKQEKRGYEIDPASLTVNARK